MMANPKAHSQYQLHPQTLPRVRAEAGRVVVRLELVSLSDHNDRPDVEVLEGGTASILGQEIQRAAQSNYLADFSSWFTSRNGGNRWIERLAAPLLYHE
jgi:hypothetical protein